MIRKNYGRQKTTIFLQLILLNQYLNKQNRTISTYKNVGNIVKSRRVSVCSSVLFRFKPKKQDVKKLAKGTGKFLQTTNHDCIENWENQLGQLEVEQISSFWNFDQSSSEETKTPEKASHFLSVIFLMTSASMKHLHSAISMPPSRRSPICRNSKTQKLSLN